MFLFLTVFISECSWAKESQVFGDLSLTALNESRARLVLARSYVCGVVPMVRRAVGRRAQLLAVQVF